MTQIVVCTSIDGNNFYCEQSVVQNDVIEPCFVYCDVTETYYYEHNTVNLKVICERFAEEFSNMKCPYKNYYIETTDKLVKVNALPTSA